MKLTVRRKYFKPYYTIGQLLINGKYYCDTLEDTDRKLYDYMPEKYIKEKKIPSETCIPYGTYPVQITYSTKYRRMMPLISNVKGFTGIRIHSGNTQKDTSGCILVGENRQVGRVINSRATYNKLYDVLYSTWKHGENITITIE